ncbi:MAG TPA: cyclic nucleotide-binding domain-containing protein [Polyangia bacterium]|jgi:CRP-like cAMP-binding protein|nr:cyclic nucleotide-binding domain-containing protein [Polyangia bacterium]
MGSKLRDLKSQARALAAGGDAVRALAAYDHLLATNPLDNDSRLKIADLLFVSGDKASAAEVYRAVAVHDIRSGHPLPAIIGMRALESLGQSVEDIVTLMADLYARDAPSLAKFAARPAPVDLDAELTPPDLSRAGTPEKVATRARDRALDFSAFVKYPEQFLPLAFFSELPREVFEPVVRALKVKRLGDGQLVIREGEPGVAFYLVAAGQLSVFATDSFGRRNELTRLHEGALFGEMALLAVQPRTASVQVIDEADVLELSREALARLEGEVPTLAETLGRFARERLLKNLLATSPLFRPFTRQQKMDLIRRFDGHEVATGTEIIREGEVGLGLFVVLAGEVEVSKRPPDGGAEVTLARLRAGDIFGEMSLIKNQPTSASVRAARHSTILFLAREYFQRLIEALPELRSYFEELSERRDIDTRRVLSSDSARNTDSGLRVLF